LKIIFAGTPVFAEQHLQTLIDSKHDVIAVYTQPDRPSGRGKKLQASPVKLLAEAHNIPVVQPLNFKEQTDRQTLAAFDSDLMIVVAYGILLPKAVLDTPKHGCINVHGSILPRWRGAAPIQRAIEAGDTQSGVTIMQMDIGLDTGDMLVKSYCDIGTQDTSSDLHDHLAQIGPKALLSTLEQIETGTCKPEKQNDAESNYASKISKEEALIDWSLSAEIVSRKIRAFNPFPVAYSYLDTLRVKIYSVRIEEQSSANVNTGALSITNGKLLVTCGLGSLSIEVLQVPGKKAMDAAAYLNGLNQVLPASSFSNTPN